MKKRPPVEPGDEIYVPSSWSIDHGFDDMDGGIATIENVEFKYNDWFATFVGLTHSFNLSCILDRQEALEAQYGSSLAHECPEGQMCPNPQKFDPETFQIQGIKRKVN